jgi:small subunit ribosomal protein S3e
MENEAKGCEVIVSGKLRSQRAKAMKFCDGYGGLSFKVTRQIHEEVWLFHY